MLYDEQYVAGNRPQWSYMNHRSLDPNLEIRTPRQGCRVAWYALRDIPTATELCFIYGGDTADYDALESPPIWLGRRNDDGDLNSDAPPTHRRRLL